MSEEKKKQLIKEGKLNPDGSYPQQPDPEPSLDPDAVDAVAEAEAIIADTAIGEG